MDALDTAGLAGAHAAHPHIQVLPASEACKIAAGEVADRPSALVREFLDNAIDAKSSTIELNIEDGGITKIEVIDDGCGMNKEDLQLCILNHATSKIQSLDDLLEVDTLGFRGEALAAAAAVSRLEILTSVDGREAWCLKSGLDPSARVKLEQSRRERGTTVRATGIFDAIPARKRFLKRPAAEAYSCRQVFIEKALACPRLAFRFSENGKLKLFLQQCRSYKERFADLFLSTAQLNFLHEIAAAGAGFTAALVAGGPELPQNNRRQQYVFANRHRIADFALQQAIEYGLSGWFPNDTHPMAAVFLTIEPRFADFNIHPAKREARFNDPGTLHTAISSSLHHFTREQQFYAGAHDTQVSEENAALPLEQSNKANDNTSSQQSTTKLALQALGEAGDFERVPSQTAAERPPRDSAIQYLGTLFDVFLLVQKGEMFYLIDQHAAHERILYERFLSGPIVRQELLVPLVFCTETPEDDAFLTSIKPVFDMMGISLAKNGEQWHITALPEAWRYNDSETVHELLKLKEAGKNILEHWAALLSCRAAIKEGDYLDRETALGLAEQSFQLPVPLCPHGRPIRIELSKADLYKAVKRL
ncbi:DNA mismatch repair endonuclease MutL [Breznakiellaceae bacterium SP9]